MITVVIPVGPSESNKRWLEECLDSVKNQTRKADEILLIDDQAHLDHDLYEGVNIWKTPWLSGVAHAFNFGVSIAQHELVVMLGSDDLLETTALEKLVEAYEKNKQQDAYYYFTIRYSDTGELQDEPCNCAAVTKGLWNLTGGFPPESEIGACDSIFISMMMVNHGEKLVPVAKGEPLFTYRVHNESDTGTRSAAYQGPIFVVRDVFTRNWKKPVWT